MRMVGIMRGVGKQVGERSRIRQPLATVISREQTYPDPIIFSSDRLVYNCFSLRIRARELHALQEPRRSGAFAGGAAHGGNAIDINH